MTVTDRSGPLAVALDDLLVHLDPATLSALRSTVPVGLRDQCDAAARQIQVGLSAISSDNTMTTVAAAEAPDWLRLGAVAALAGWLTGASSTCLHQPHPTRPQPIVAAAWRPGLITCGHCTHLFRLPDTAADRTCDCCGRVTTGPDHGDPIYPALIVIGLLTYTYGACTACMPDSTRRSL